MLVTEEHVAALKAQLQGKREEHQRLLAEIDFGSRSNQEGYAMLISMAFLEVASSRFSDDAEVIKYVAEVRASAPELAKEIDPNIGERLIRAAYADEEIDDIDARIMGTTQILLLASLVHSAQLSEEGLDELLSKAQALAES